MIRAEFRIELPETTWVSEVSRAYPDATFRLLTGLRTGDTAVELGEVAADSPAAVGDAIRDHPSIADYQRLDAAEGTVLARYETSDVALYEFAAGPALAPEYPVVVRDGWFEFDLTGTRTEFERLRDGLEASDLGYELLSIVGDADSDGLLTDRQREVLGTALRMGYFEVPRACTLADVAAALDVDKSTASGVLRRGEARVLKRFLTGPGREPPR
ncbi:helix-turn-helix domain-containing protein [Halostella litorea]|uniref:helix-turn-helix domain-containing protein n=1 Tax=Halostella litorea TaxID=2528831 RepID=UPI0010922655|nr:helix-turn-helix domain-containing protein [Halostella litorea]